MLTPPRAYLQMLSLPRILPLLVLISLPQVSLGATITINAVRFKVKFPSEIINIDNISYEIPHPWRGNRIRVPAIPSSAFRMIPRDHTRNSTKLYITEDAHTALLKMFEAAKEEGIHLVIESGYRSPGYQKKIFKRMLSEGREFNDIIRYVAPPGYSQHALGTAVDFYPSNWSFAERVEYTWLKENGADFGFSETYPQNNSLHYPWEAWHWNYTP